MYRQPADDHDRHWIRNIASNSPRRFLMRDGAHRQGVIPNHVPIRANDVGTRGPASLILQRPPSQPVVERLLSTFEFREIMFVATFAATHRSHWVRIYCSQGAFVLSSRRNLALLAGGLSSMQVKRLKSS